MSLKRRIADNLKTEETTVIASGVKLNGMTRGTGNIVLNGKMEGNIEVSGTLVLGKSGQVRGDINARNVIVGGVVEGTIRATEKVEIREGGRCKGDIFTAMIAVCENAYLEGNVKMHIDAGEPAVLHFTEKRTSQTEKAEPQPQ